MTRILRKNDNTRIFGGVCGALQEHFGINIILLRILFCIAIFGYGIGAYLYFILWIFLPNEDKNAWF